MVVFYPEFTAQISKGRLLKATKMIMVFSVPPNRCGIMLKIDQ